MRTLIALSPPRLRKAQTLADEKTIRPLNSGHLTKGQMVDSIMSTCMAAMAALALYVLTHDLIGVADEMIWLDSLAAADILGVAVTAQGCWNK